MISIIIPVIRPEKAKQCIDAIGNREDIEIITKEDTKRIGVAKMVKRLVEKSSGDMIMFLGDDTVPQEGFIEEALKAMAMLPDGWGMVGLNDGRPIRHEATHFLIDKRMLPLIDNEIFHTGYLHCFCDSELALRARLLGRYAFAERALIKHNHPLIDKEIEQDDDYKRVYSKEYWKHDKDLFEQRKQMILENL